MTQLKIALYGLVFMLNGSSFADYPNCLMPFTAKFYDEQGHFIGAFGTTDDNSPIYIIAYEHLFPYKSKKDYAPITPLEIVQLVGTEIISDRHTPIVELKLHIGVCKLPPKAHRDDIRKIIEDVHFDCPSHTSMHRITQPHGPTMPTSFACSNNRNLSKLNKTTFHPENSE